MSMQTEKGELIIIIHASPWTILAVLQFYLENSGLMEH